MGLPERTNWGPGRSVFWGLATLVAVTFIGPRFVTAFRPQGGMQADFVQEWLSAKNYWAGTPVYSDQTQALARHTGMVPERGAVMLPWNAHPPASVLVSLPFAFLDYPDAHLLWNLLTFPLLPLSILLVVRELGIDYSAMSVFPTVALCLFCHPLYIQVFQGQWNLVLLSLLVLAWLADRRGYQVGAGAAVGLAAALKLYPAFVFLYFLCARRWRAVWSGIAVGAAVTAVTWAVFGTDTFRTYLRDVLPSLQVYRCWWQNVSATAFWLRILDPSPTARITPLSRSPELAQLLVFASQLAVVGVVAYVSWRARDGARRDRAFWLAVTGILLVSPIAWTHYFLLLLVPVALLWVRLPSGWLRWLFWMLFPLFLVPDRLFPILAGTSKQSNPLADRPHAPVTPQANLVRSGHTYVLATFFVLLAAAPLKRPEEGGPPETAGVEADRVPGGPRAAPVGAAGGVEAASRGP